VRRLHVLAEGQTEEAIARNVIAPFFSGSDSCVTWSICPTSRPVGGPAYPRYLKTVDGPRVITTAGLPAIRAACPHADDWLAKLEARILKRG
jgi:hypothetical protein